MEYIRLSNFFKYFVRDRKSRLFQCRICSEYGRETICVNCTYHIRQQHVSIYSRQKERLMG
jgi:recombinational DNA repair protein RecR